MITLWYIIVSFILINYVVLDGRNFGVGILHWLVAKTPEERRQVIAVVGPLYSWDEVWLVAFGGTLVAVFPQLMATAFSGYYLALFLILWCLILRGGGVEVGGHLNDPMWRTFWDVIFSFSSVLLAFVFGAAGGNLARGVPLDAQGQFAMAFFTDFNVRGNVGILDWYTVSIGVFAMLILAAQGSTYLAVKTEAAVHDRSVALGRRLWIAVVPLFVVISLESWYVRPDLLWNALHNPLAWLGSLVVFGAAASLAGALRRGQEWRAFFSANTVVAGMLATGAATIYPVMLYSTLAPQNSLTAEKCAANATSLAIALIWAPIALVFAAFYFVFLMRHYSGKVEVQQDNQGFPEPPAEARP